MYSGKIGILTFHSLLFAYRVQESGKESPFYLLYAQDPYSIILFALWTGSLQY